MLESTTVRGDHLALVLSNVWRRSYAIDVADRPQALTASLPLVNREPRCYQPRFQWSQDRGRLLLVAISRRRHAARDSAVDQRACTATEPWRKGACRWGSSSVSWWAEYPANGVVATGSDPIVRTVSGLREREGVRSNREVAGMKAQSRAACSLRAPDQWVSRWHGPYIAWRRGGSC